MSVLRELMLKILLKKEVDVMQLSMLPLSSRAGRPLTRFRQSSGMRSSRFRKTWKLRSEERGGVRREPRPILFERA